MFYDKYNSTWFSWLPSIWRKDNKSKLEEIKQAGFGRFGDSIFHDEKSWWDRYKYYVYGAISIISLFFMLDLFKPDTPYISDITNFFRKSYNAVSSTIISAKSLVFTLHILFMSTFLQENLFLINLKIGFLKIITQKI